MFDALRSRARSRSTSLRFFLASLAIGVGLSFVSPSAVAQTGADVAAPRASQARTPDPLPVPDRERAPSEAAFELSFEPAFFFGGNAPPDPGYFALFRFAGPIVGFDIGYLTNVGLPGDPAEPLQGNTRVPSSRTQTTAFVFGANFLHLSRELVHRGPNRFSLLLPEPDLRLLFSFADVPSSSLPSRTSGGLIVAPGVSALGFRFTRYVGNGWSWVSEVRGPTAFAYIPLMYGGDTSNPYLSVGFSISTGFAL